MQNTAPPGAEPLNACGMLALGQPCVPVGLCRAVIGGDGEEQRGGEPPEARIPSENEKNPRPFSRGLGKERALTIAISAGGERQQDRRTPGAPECRAPG
jgi:hypothetical protein